LSFTSLHKIPQRREANYSIYNSSDTKKAGQSLYAGESHLQPTERLIGVGIDTARQTTDRSAGCQCWAIAAVQCYLGGAARS